MSKLISGIVEWAHTLAWLVRMFPHFVLVASRQTIGRWYYFRDRPLWFVVTMADMPLEETSEQLATIIREARAEMRRRLEQNLRQAEAMCPGNEGVSDAIAAVREQLKKLGE